MHETTWARNRINHNYSELSWITGSATVFITTKRETKSKHLYGNLNKIYSNTKVSHKNTYTDIRKGMDI